MDIVKTFSLESLIHMHIHSYTQWYSHSHNIPSWTSHTARASSTIVIYLHASTYTYKRTKAQYCSYVYKELHVHKYWFICAYTNTFQSIKKCTFIYSDTYIHLYELLVLQHLHIPPHACHHQTSIVTSNIDICICVSTYQACSTSHLHLLLYAASTFRLGKWRS